MQLKRIASVILAFAISAYSISGYTEDKAESAQSVEQDRALIREVIKLINERNLDEAFELYSVDYIFHGAGGEVLNGRDAIRNVWGAWLVGFPDLHSTIEDIVTEGDKLALRFRVEGAHTGEFLGMAPTNAKINVRDIEIFRIANGQIVEAWDQIDMFGLMQQLGAIPTQAE